MRPCFARAFLVCRLAIFASLTFSFGHFRHTSRFDSLAASLILGCNRAFTIALLIVKNGGSSAQIP
jgi:hypothetical protein